MVQSNRQPNTQSSENNRDEFKIWQQLKQINTLDLVKVVAVYEKTLDVKPLLNSLSPDGTAIDSGVIYGIPFKTYQGGANAIKIIPQVGDIGLCGFCQRDISGVISTGMQSNPLSGRMFDCADGVYICTLWGYKQPERYIEINDNQITINGSVPVVINASKTTINSDTQINGTLNVSGDVIAGTISLQTHVHSGVTAGQSNTGAPV